MQKVKKTFNFEPDINLRLELESVFTKQTQSKILEDLVRINIKVRDLK